MSNTVTKSAAAKQAATDAVCALIDAGTGAGKLKLLSAADAVLAILTMDDPAMGAANSGGTATAGTITSSVGEAAAGLGTAATKFQVTDSDDTVIFSATVAQRQAITGVSQGSKTFTVAGALAGLVAGDIIVISGSTGNDGVYHVVSTSGAGPTIVTVMEAVPNATVDGYLCPAFCQIDNPSIAVGQAVGCSSLTYNDG